MAKPVKTLLMDAFEMALNTLKPATVSMVKRGQDIPIDEETAVYPWVCFFDEPEAKKARNRISMKDFDLVVHAWVKQKVSTTLSDQLDLLDAEIEKLFLTNAGIGTYTMNIEPLSMEKFYIDDEVRAILQAVYHVTYGHKWKDPYDPAKGS